MGLRAGGMGKFSFLKPDLYPTDRILTLAPAVIQHEATINRQQLDKYSAALDQLPVEDREAIIGRVEFGLSYAELAELLGKSTPDAARKMVSRALVKLAQQMP